jgi:methyl-accepting chemotaxis protein
MKKLGLLITGIVIVSALSYAQKISVKETIVEFDNGKHNAFETIIYKSDTKTVEKAWESLMKDYGASVKSKKEIFADDATIKTISANTIDVYAIVKELKDGEVKLWVAFDLGGAFISSTQHAIQFDQAMQIVQDFAINITKESFDEFISEEERSLEKLQNKHDRMVSDKDNLKKQNEDYRERIEKNTQEMEQLTKDIEEQLKEIEEKAKEIEEIKTQSQQIK